MKKVLIVDDDVDIRKVVSKLVEKSGYITIEAKNGVEGMGKVREDKPDLIILDILMPKESGVRMYRELKTEEPLKNIPVIVLPEAYIEKPEEPEELIALMKKILG